MTDQLIIGIDFGTTYSGVAWALSSNPKEINIINDWDGVSGPSDKVPTQITYHDSGTVMGWGFSQSYGISQPGWCKLLLFQDKQLRNTALDAQAHDMKNPGRLPVEVVADYLRSLWCHVSLSLRRTLGRQLFDHVSIQLVLTVPMYWDHGAQNLLKTAAKWSGMLTRDNVDLSLISEQEAAASYMLKDFPSALRVGDIVTVCDAGGGTVDLVNYTVDKLNPPRLTELSLSSGTCPGAVSMDDSFHNLMKAELGPEVYRRLSPVSREGIKAEWERIKTSFDQLSNSKDKWYFNIPDHASRSANSRTSSSEPGKMALSRDKIEPLFGKACSNIITLIRNQFETLAPQESKAIFIVGGLGGNRYLWQELDRVFRKRPLHRPLHAWTAICRGAVISKLPHERPLMSRICRYHYGIKYDEDFDASRHLLQDKVWHDLECTWKAANQMKWYLSRGDEISDDQTITFRWYCTLKHVAELQGVQNSIYFCTQDTATSRLSQEVMKLCQITATFDPNLWESLSKKTNTHGQEYRILAYDISMRLTSGELSWSLVYNGEQRRKASISVDYMDGAFKWTIPKDKTEAETTLEQSIATNQETATPLPGIPSKEWIGPKTMLDKEYESDSESAPSISNSIFSLESAMSVSTKPTTEGPSEDEPGIDGIVKLLTTDVELKLLYTKVIKTSKIDSNKFQRNFRRLLRQFSIDLKNELPGELAKVPIFIRTCKGTIAGRIWTAIDYRQERLPETLIQEPLDEVLKKQRLAKYLSQRIPATKLLSGSISVDPDVEELRSKATRSSAAMRPSKDDIIDNKDLRSYSEDDMIGSKDLRSDSEDDMTSNEDRISDSEESSSSGSSDGIDSALRYSSALEGIIRQSEALACFRINFQAWLDLKPKPPNKHQNSPDTPPPMDDSNNKFDESLALIDFASRIAFVPRSHILRVGIMKERRQTYLSQIQLALENYTKQPWNWWPLPLPVHLLSPDVVQLQWVCACGHSRTTDVQSSTLQSFLQDARANYSSQNSSNHIISRASHRHSVLSREAPGLFDPIETEKTLTVKLPDQFPITSTWKATPNLVPLGVSVTQPSIPTQAHLGSQAGPTPASGTQSTPRQRFSGSNQFSTPKSGTQGIVSTSKNTIVMPTSEHVLLAINRGHRLRLAQINRSVCTDDSEFFKKLKEEYKSKRGIMRRLFDVKHFHHCEFVEFEKPCYQKILRRRKGYPHDIPRHLAHYRYRPTAQEPQEWKDPPILPDEFYDRFYGCSNCMLLEMSYFHHCSHFCPVTIERVERIPKRTIPLELDAQGQEEAWGLHAVEYISTVRVIAYHVLMLIGPLIFWALWLWYWNHKADLQNAIVPFTCMIPLLSMFWALLKGDEGH